MHMVRQKVYRESVRLAVMTVTSALLFLVLTGGVSALAQDDASPVGDRGITEAAEEQEGYQSEEALSGGDQQEEGEPQDEDIASTEDESKSAGESNLSESEEQEGANDASPSTEPADDPVVPSPELEAMASISFSDVNSSTPHVSDIRWLASMGISEGWIESDGRHIFRGMDTVKRQDMAAFLFRLAKAKGLVSESWQPTNSQKRAFSDVDSSTPHAREIWWLASAGISTGYSDGTFRGMDTVCRQDMAAFLFRLAKKANQGNAFDWWCPSLAQISRFSDVSSSTPHAREILWLAAKSVSSGYTDGTFKGMEPVYRQDMAAFLHRLYSLSSSSSYSSDGTYTIHFTGADFVMPMAMRGLVNPVIGQRAGTDERVLYENSMLIGWNPATAEWLDQWRASGKPSDYRDVSRETLSDGTVLIFGAGNDCVCSVEIVSPTGRKGYLWTFACMDFLYTSFGMNRESVVACRWLQATVAGRAVNDDPYQNAFAFLRACAQRVKFKNS